MTSPEVRGHTPGSWTVTHNSWEVSTVYGPGGETVAVCPINSVVTEDTQFEHEAVKEANALTIAVLPDIMAALEAADEAWEGLKQTQLAASAVGLEIAQGLREGYGLNLTLALRAALAAISRTGAA